MKQKISVVTGATSGIGLGIAKALVAKGINVALVARTKSKLKEIQKDLLQNDKQTQVLIFAGNVSDEKFAESIFDNLGNEFEIQNLFNCAGSGVFGTIFENNRKMIDECFDGIVFGTIVMTTKALQLMKSNENGGSVVNILSQSSLRTYKKESVYCAAKWAQKGFSECLRGELFGTKIKVICVYPGGVNSPFWKDSRDYVSEELQKSFIDPTELGQMIVEAVLQQSSVLLKDLVIEQRNMNLE